MSENNEYIMETEESSNQIQLNEIYYNCNECSSPIEIISINENSIEFKCINNNHKKKILIKDYIKEMKKYNNKEINNDKCIHNNNIYECICLDCNKHLCKECLKTREHINHQKINIIEIKPNKNEINIIENIIKYYEDKIDNIEKEKLKITLEINNKYKEIKDKINKNKEIKIKENKNNLIKELKLNKDKYILDIKNINKKYENEIKLRKYKYNKDINEINNKYKIIIENNNIIYKNKIENIDNKYIKIIQKYKYNKKIENMEGVKRK